MPVIVKDEMLVKGGVFYPDSELPSLSQRAREWAPY